MHKKENFDFNSFHHSRVTFSLAKRMRKKVKRNKIRGVGETSSFSSTQLPFGVLMLLWGVRVSEVTSGLWGKSELLREENISELVKGSSTQFTITSLLDGSHQVLQQKRLQTLPKPEISLILCFKANAS
jgi:hypothetical protein